MNPTETFLVVRSSFGQLGNLEEMGVSVKEVSQGGWVLRFPGCFSVFLICVP